MNEKEEKFRARQQYLNNRKKIKKLKYRLKIERRAKFWKNPFVILMRWLIRIGIVVLIFFIYNLVKDLQDNYNDSRKWTNEKGPALAMIPPDLIYSNAANKQKALDYIEVLNKIWNTETEDFKTTASQENIDQLNLLAKELNISKFKDTSWMDNYRKVNDLWKIQKQYLQYFENNDTVPVTTSLKNVQDFVNKNTNTLSKYLLKPGKKTFVNRMKVQMEKLSSDVLYVEELLNTFNTYYSISPSVVIVKETTLSTDLNNYEAVMANLKFKWQIVNDRLVNLRLKSNKILNQNYVNLNNYNDYLQDIENKNNFTYYKNTYKQKDKELKSRIISLKSFKNKDIDDLKEWAEKNNINLSIQEKESGRKIGTILEQLPDTDNYDKILKGSIISVVIAKEKVEIPTTEEPTTEKPTTEKPTTEEPTTEDKNKDKDISSEDPTTELPSIENKIVRSY